VAPVSLSARVAPFPAASAVPGTGLEVIANMGGGPVCVSCRYYVPAIQGGMPELPWVTTMAVQPEAWGGLLFL